MVSWRDIIATVLIAGAIAVAYVKFTQWDWRCSDNWKLSTLLVFTLGMGACAAIGAVSVPARDVWTVLATALSVSAFTLMVGELIIGGRIIFFTLVWVILALWFVTAAHLMVTFA